MFPRMKTIALLGIGVLGAPAFAANSAHPGTVNYVEGAAFIEGKQLNEKSVGTADLDIGEVLSTAAGKAEILLTPGVFLRVDENSAVKMISPDITPTQAVLRTLRLELPASPGNPASIIRGTGTVTHLPDRYAATLGLTLKNSSYFAPWTCEN